MLKEYKTVHEGAEAEIIEKKSRFIATVQPVHSEEEAINFIEGMRKKYWNATHNCFAYVIGERFEIQRFSDDGEPSGTAGKPMLDVLMGEEVHDTLVVVTRYFGGTLLGTGGLVRAYQGSTKAGLEASKIITKYAGKKIKVTTDYTGLGKIQYLLAQRKIPTLDSIYTDKVELIILVQDSEYKAVTDELIEGTNGQVILEDGDACYFAEIDKEIHIFEQ